MQTNRSWCLIVKYKNNKKTYFDILFLEMKSAMCVFLLVSSVNTR